MSRHVGQETRDRREPREGQDHRGVPRHEYVVESSIGHIRDLPERASDVPKEERAYGALGVAVDDGFSLLHRRPGQEEGGRRAEAKLKDPDELLLATDEDREGEAIAFHLVEALKPKVPVPLDGLPRDHARGDPARARETRDIDQRLVDAQETRRILDRLYGYEVSPVLWKKVAQGLPAGRVQSVATPARRRARARADALRRGSLLGRARHLRSGRLRGAAGLRRRPTDRAGRDFGPDGKAREDVVVLDEERRAGSRPSSRAGVRGALRRREAAHAPPGGPVPTSTLQQEASRKLRFSSQTTMRVAQRLYENGYITYMRTDSVTLSETALKAARAQAAEVYGAEIALRAPAPARWRTRRRRTRRSGRPATRSDAEAGRARAVARRVRPLRADLEAHDRLADEGRAGQTVKIRLGATTEAAMPSSAPPAP